MFVEQKAPARKCTESGLPGVQQADRRPGGRVARQGQAGAGGQAAALANGRMGRRRRRTGALASGRAGRDGGRAGAQAGMQAGRRAAG